MFCMRTEGRAFTMVLKNIVSVRLVGMALIVKVNQITVILRLHFRFSVTFDQRNKGACFQADT